jgi:anti-sigma factor ChrR (cupin superfamily)
MAEFDANDPDLSKKMRAMFGPGQLDQSIRHAIQMCWMMLPEDRKTIDELETQLRRVLERAFKDLREDAQQFGLDV